MTNKDFVLTIYPDAFCVYRKFQYEDEYICYTASRKILGYSLTSEDAAWGNARSVIHALALRIFEDD